MDNQDELLKAAFKIYAEDTKLTEQKKNRMLEHILVEGKTEKTTSMAKWKRLIITYPWRFALTASVVQAVIFTMFFGTKYTNLFLNYFGG